MAAHFAQPSALGFEPVLQWRRLHADMSLLTCVLPDQVHVAAHFAQPSALGFEPLQWRRLQGAIAGAKCQACRGHARQLAQLMRAYQKVRATLCTQNSSPWSARREWRSIVSLFAAVSCLVKELGSCARCLQAQ